MVLLEELYDASKTRGIRVESSRMSAQDAVDASDHFEVDSSKEVPSLCSIIIDTNPRAWAALASVLPLSAAVANILIFANSHLSLSSSNRIAIIASHSNRAAWLYPSPPKPPSEDVEMGDAGSRPSKPAKPHLQTHSSNKFPQFAEIESSVLGSLRALIDETNTADISLSTSAISGALSLALAHISKTAGSLNAAVTTAATGPPGSYKSSGRLAGLHARILTISVSDSFADQYIPTMNAVFAAEHARIPIDTLVLRGNPTFLEQASSITRGTFIRATNPHGLLQYLMMGFSGGSAPSAPSADTDLTGGKKTAGAKGAGRGLPPGTSVSSLLNTPRADSVDFRTGCFCHRRIVDKGFVCSVCLSIFCEVPEDATCLMCGTKLKLGNYGAEPVVRRPAGP